MINTNKPIPYVFAMNLHRLAGQTISPTTYIR